MLGFDKRRPRNGRPRLFWPTKRSLVVLGVASLALLSFVAWRDKWKGPSRHRRKIAISESERYSEEERVSWPLVSISVVPSHEGGEVNIAFLHEQAGSRGSVSDLLVAGTMWTEQRWPLNPGIESCTQEVNEGFRFRATYTLTDRMNDRSTQEPSFRFIQLLRALPKQKSPVSFPRMTAADSVLACSHLDALRPETLPAGGCPGRKAVSEPVSAAPWCAPWDASVFIGELSCGFMQSCSPHADMAYMIIAESGAVMSHKKLMVSFPPEGVPLQEFDALASPGYAEYTDAAGHFPNEVLPRLLHLDRFLPVDIPLVWPAGVLPGLILELLQEAGLMSKQRRFIVLPSSGQVTFARAKKLYFYGTTAPLSASPVVTWFSQRVLAASYRLLAERLSNSTTSPWFHAAAKKRKLLYLQRPARGGRSLSNEAELLEALRQVYADRSRVEILTLMADSYNFPETMLAAREADVIIGVHGANLNNIFFAREGAAVVEIGFLQPSFHLPSDYLCLARNLGLHHWTVFPVSGGHAEPVEADVHRTVQAVQEALKAVTAKSAVD